VLVSDSILLYVVFYRGSDPRDRFEGSDCISHSGSKRFIFLLSSIYWVKVTLYLLNKKTKKTYLGSSAIKKL
jgi:hypothetical protein